MCSCKYLEALFALIILVFSFWEINYSKWVIAVSAVVLLVHSLACGCHGSCSCMSESSKKSKKKR